MTREEAIKSALKYLVRKQQEQGSWGYADNDNINKVPWDEVLEWIDKQSCGDLISRQAALEVLDDYTEDIESGNFGAYTRARISMLKLPSVEPESCGDCIRRQAVLDLAESGKLVSNGNYKSVCDAINGLPSVEPEIEKCEDCINRKDMIKKLNNLCNNICEYSKKQRKSMCDACNLSFVFDMIDNAKSVEPERKKGKWIKVVNPDTNEWVGGFKCSECDRCCAQMSMKYCANCGAQMEVAGE